MKTFLQFDFNASQCLIEVREFRKLLNGHGELGENKDILPFFKQNHHLSAFIASYVPSISKYDLLAYEYDLFGDFAADLVVGDSRSKNFLFVEFEDAKRFSVFKKASGRSTPDWANRVEHGISQIIDWFWKKQIIQALILGAIGYTAAYVFYPLLTLILPRSASFLIPLSNNLNLVVSASAIVAIILAIFLVIILYKYPEWYVIDISGIIIGTGAIAIFGMSLGILLVIILLIGLAIYDAISVYKTKHMIVLADTPLFHPSQGGLLEL